MATLSDMGTNHRTGVLKMFRAMIFVSLMVSAGACTIESADPADCGSTQSSGHASGSTGSGSGEGNGNGNGGNAEGSGSSGSGQSGATCEQVCDNVEGCGFLGDGTTFGDCVAICDEKTDQDTRDWAAQASCDELQTALDAMFGGA